MNELDHSFHPFHGQYSESKQEESLPTVITSLNISFSTGTVDECTKLPINIKDY